LAWSGEVFSGMGCMISHPFATRGNRPYLEFWAVISDMCYPRYFPPTVAPEPSVERVVKNVLSTGGGIGGHMLLWPLPWDLVARLWGLEPP
jgi:hypothetical protein